MLGQLLETFVLQELRRLDCATEVHSQFYHLRDKDGVEVDIVMAHGNGKLSGIEVKASSTVSAQDFKGLRKLQASEPDRFHCDVLLYDGEGCLRFGEGVFAVPVSRLMV